MSSAIDRRELAFKSLAGFAGGAIGWVPVELVSRGHSLTQIQSGWEVFASFLSMAILSGLIGGLITASEAGELTLTRQVSRRLIRGFIICSILSVPATYYSNEIFGAILSAGGWSLNHPGSPVALVLGRLAGWTLMGLLLGAGVGLATFSMRNVMKGGAGGWVGGFVGGLSFDLVSRVSGGLLSRFIGLSAIGFAIGLFIGLVQQLTKSAWVSVESGRLQGRQYRLDRPVSGVGRAEENPVGLFGDPGVSARHAVIEKTASGFQLKNLAVHDGTFVNGKRIEQVELHDGDRIRISDYELSFHVRQVAGDFATPSASTSASTEPPARPEEPPVAAAVSRTPAGPQLKDTAGQSYTLAGASITRLGRAVDNDIVINHASVSRHHASLSAINGAFEVRDLGSQNGTYIGGHRVAQGRIEDGDSIRFGSVEFTFHA